MTTRAAARQAEKALRQLLRTPKTREGLVAAVLNKDITKNFVFGFLTMSVRTGEVVKLKSTRPYSYQIRERLSETPATGVFPAWLEPRTLPPCIGSRVFIDGLPVSPEPPRKEQEEEQHDPFDY